MTAGPLAGPATLLADRYRLVERIATGGMGEVWRAEDTLLGRVVAVKTLKAEYVGDDGFRARFRAEARHAGRLSHPGIASVFDFGESADSAWLVMELVDGEPLSGLLHRQPQLSVERTLDVVAQTAAALQTAHDGGVVHRDVKPGNLLVRRDGVLKVTDFGIASATDAVPLTQTGTVVGTAYYLSPEQAAGRSASPASDVYSLGVVAYECLVGARPFPGTNPVAVALAHLREEPPALPSTIPVGVRELVARALAKEPEDRFPDADAMAGRALELLEELAADDCYPAGASGLAGLPVAPPPGAADAHTSLIDSVAPDERRRRLRLPGAKARSSRSAVRVAAALLLVLAVGIGVSAGTPDATPDVDDVAATTPSTPATSSPATAPTPPPLVDASAYIGTPAAEARAALADRGLVPRLAYDGSGAAVGTVSSVEPSGPLEMGTAVLLHVVPQPAPVVEAVVPVEAAPERVEEKGPPSDKGGPAGGTGNKGRGNR